VLFAGRWIHGSAGGGSTICILRYQEQCGWKDRIYQWTWDSVTFDGNVYAIGNELEMIGVYYNTAIFDELGVAPPTTYDEYVDIAEKAKAAGYIPIAFANKPGWPAFHTFSAYANNLAGKEGMDAVFASEKPWTDPEFVEAIKIPFVDQNQADYFIPSPNAVDYPEGNEIFYAGQAAMHLTGMWLLGDILANTDFEVGFFALPVREGRRCCTPGRMGSAVMISSATST
jgi:raffinose/stachyose/melibiose transport system substrate-binding protein